MGNPDAFNSQTIQISKGLKISRQKLLLQFVNALYSRTTGDFKRGDFRVKGDTVDIFPAYGDSFHRLSFWGNEIERIEVWDPISMAKLEEIDTLRIFPANLFVTTPDQLNNAIKNIDKGLFPKAFCKVVPDFLTGSETHCLVMHADGAGTKS